MDVSSSCCWPELELTDFGGIFDWEMIPPMGDCCIYILRDLVYMIRLGLHACFGFLSRVLALLKGLSLLPEPVPMLNPFSGGFSAGMNCQFLDDTFICN